VSVFVAEPTFHPAYLIPIAVGSALGGMARYAMTTVVNDRANAAFPVGTLAVNVLGCLLIGILIELLGARVSHATQVFLTTGFCGGFTTFSTFSFETVYLFEQGLWQRAVLYTGLSVAGGLGAFWIGAAIVRGASGTPTG
jgi:fluoride exporter